MRQLRLVGLAEDGTSLVLESPTGESFRLPLDDRVRAAARNDLTRLGQIELETEAPLRPREIQMRVRAGESAEQVAASAGMPVDRVLRFAYPVLQERGRVVNQARTTPVRPPEPETLGTLVEERLVSRGTHPDTLEWDAWRHEDGRWLVQLSWRHDTGRSHAACWSLDLARRALQPEDAAAEQLTAKDFLLRTITAVTPLAVAARAADQARTHRDPGPPAPGRPVRTAAAAMPVPARSEPATRPEPAARPEPVARPEPAARPETGARPESAARPEPVAEVEPEPDPEPVRIAAVRAVRAVPEPTASEPTASERATPRPTAPRATAADPATPDPATPEPATSERATPRPTAPEAVGTDPTTREPTTPERATSQRATPRPTAPEATAADPTGPNPTTSERATPRPTAAEAIAADPAAPEAVAAEAAAPEPGVGVQEAAVAIAEPAGEEAAGQEPARDEAGRPRVPVSPLGDHRHPLPATGTLPGLEGLEPVRDETPEERARRATVPSWDDILLGIRRRH